MNGMRIAGIEPLVFNVSEKTNWFFIRVTTVNGLAGIGDLQDGGHTRRVHGRDRTAVLPGTDRGLGELHPRLAQRQSHGA